MTSQKEKRGAIGARRRRDLSLFVTDLQQLQSKFPRIRLDIQYFIDEVLTDIARTREGDRQAVLDVFADWQTPLKVEEIMEDTGLSERVVRGVLDELLQSDPPLLFVSERPGDSERGRPAKVYDLAKCLTEIK